MVFISIFLFGLFPFVFVESKTRFSLKITKYHTYSYVRLDGYCCGTQDNGNMPCRPPCLQWFKICLEEHQIEVSSTNPSPHPGPCAFGVHQTTLWGNSDMNFGKSYAYTYNIDVPNSWPGRVALIIEAYDNSDQSYSNKAVIDRVVYRSIFKPSSSRETSPEWHNVSLMNGQSIYEFSIKIVCSKNYFGVACDKYCENKTKNYQCDENGDKICNQGWMGVDCNTTICKSGCHPVHGYCVEPGECLCTEGWKGPYCDECISYPGCKHGKCLASPWTCACNYNWGGDLCDQNLNFCADNNPCKNGGICENSPYKADPYYCVCPTGYSGKNCEHDVCLPNRCIKGVCVRSKEGFHCQCFTGWEGKYCDKGLCDGKSCVNGECETDGLGRSKCVCRPGYRGSECHISSPCENSKCKHAKDCQIQSLTLRDYKCICQNGWTGKFCDKEIDECESKPCKNGGICKDLKGGYSCSCKPGFNGKNCEVNVACESKPCRNGVCLQTDDGFMCKCKNGYSGKHCEIYKSGCIPNPCQNGAYCYTIEEDIFCQCKKDYWGKLCEFQRPYCGKEPCSSIYDSCSIPKFMNSSGISKTICGDYGTCISKQDQGFECKCMSGFEGTNCEININDCKENSCSGNGICIDRINDFDCICDNGYEGKQCEKPIDYCAKNPCMNGGECKITSRVPYNDFACDCKSGWGGRLCHLQRPTVCDDNTCLNGGTCQPVRDLDASGGYRCNCPYKWTGSSCQILQNDLKVCKKEDLCKNGGVCVNVGMDDFACHCPAGFEGVHCEININECNPNPCFNGGTCKDLINSYSCECAKGFFGSNCQRNLDDCLENPCSFGSICVDRIESFECLCPEGRSGPRCESVAGDPPRPPSCFYINRIFDSGESWSHNCKDCKCNTGIITCKTIPCGVWSCEKAIGADDPYACKSDEFCHVYEYDPKRCFVPPCVPKAVCYKRNEEIPKLPVLWPYDIKGHCQPNSNRKINDCSKLLLSFEKYNMPAGVMVDDICDAIKSLPVVILNRNTEDGKYLSISCDYAEPASVNIAIYAPNARMKNEGPFAFYLSDTIASDLVSVVRRNFTVLSGLTDIRVEKFWGNSDIDDRSGLLKYLLIPIIAFGLVMLFIIILHHRKKMIEIRQKCPSSKLNNTNAHVQSVNPLLRSEGSKSFSGQKSLFPSSQKHHYVGTSMQVSSSMWPPLQRSVR